MNIQTVASNLRRTIAGKEQLLTKWQEFHPVESSDRSHKATMVGMLELNIGELKRILQDVEQCAKQAADDSWITNPDRSGGAYTAEELDPNRGWK
jgi:hypothetical protein